MQKPVQQIDIIPCRLCLGKFGQHAWQECPARCMTCNGYGHILGPNHPVGHIDAHSHIYHDVLKDSICETCHGTGILPELQDELHQYRDHMKELIARKIVPPAT